MSHGCIYSPFCPLCGMQRHGQDNARIRPQVGQYSIHETVDVILILLRKDQTQIRIIFEKSRMMLGSTKRDHPTKQDCMTAEQMEYCRHVPGRIFEGDDITVARGQMADERAKRVKLLISCE